MGGRGRSVSVFNVGPTGALPFPYGQISPTLAKESMSVRQPAGSGAGASLGPFLVVGLQSPET